MEVEYLILNDLILNCRINEAKNYINQITDEASRKILSAYLMYRSAEFERSIEVLEQLAGDNYRTFRNIIRALCYLNIGDEHYIRIMELVDKSRDILEERFITVNYLYLKSKYYSKTNPTKSVQTTAELLKLAIELEDMWMIIKSYGDMGIYYRYLGHYEQSEFFIRRKLKLLEKTRNKEMKFRGHGHLAMTLFHRRKFTESLEEIEKALKYRDDGKVLITSQLLFMQMYVQLTCDDHESAEKTYKRVEELLQTSPWNKATSMMRNLTTGIYLKSKHRLKQKITAQLYLEEVVNGKILDFEAYYIALINLLDLLVSEYAHSGQDDVLEEILSMEKKLEDFMKTSYRGMYYLQIYQLRARLLFVKKDINGALSIIKEGIQNTEDEEVRDELRRLQTEFYKKLQEWDILADTNSELMQSFVKSEILDYLSMVVDIVKK